MDALVNLKPLSLINRTSDVLTQFIVKGKMKTGDYLPPEHELCRKIGIGRSTLREAIKVLESRGLVRRIHGIGVQIVDESQKAASDMLQLVFKRRGASIRELLEVRNLYEVKAAALAAERATPEDLEAIRESVRILKSTGPTADEYLQADLNFHVAIAKASHNNVLVLVAETIRPLLQSAIIAALEVDPRPELCRHHHEEILAAIERKDSGQAADTMTQHLRDIEEMLRQMESNIS
jgi:GntR family transcriptional repressor for pyruvate dehydrogenase complex